jgi:hypothetical protein
VAIVVSDTSPIRALGHLNSIDLLRSLFGQVLAEAVMNLRDVLLSRRSFAADSMGNTPSFQESM